LGNAEEAAISLDRASPRGSSPARTERPAPAVATYPGAGRAASVPVRGPGLRPLFVLLRMGLARPARCRAAGGLLPRHFTLTGPRAGGMFLWRFPSGFPARVLPGILARRSPDFPPRLC